MSSGPGETGWVLDLLGNAINLAHVRRVVIGSRFQEAPRGATEEPDGVTVFHVEAEMMGGCTCPATILAPVLVQGLPDRPSAEHWVAVRFWQPMYDRDARPRA